MEFAKRMSMVTGSAIREIFALLAQPGMISFAGGNPSPDCFPNDEVADIASRLIRTNGCSILQYGGTPGCTCLNQTVIEMAAQRGIKASPQQVIITSGSTQGIGLAAKTLINPGDVILCESPTFIGALQTFLSYEADVKGVTMDEQGMDIDALEEAIKAHKPKFVYTIPTFQNPTGRTMSEERRKRMVEVCEKYGVLILEDDPYCDLRYSGEPVPPIKSYDKTNNVIYLISFSKIVSPGLRVGAAIADERIIAKYNVAKQGEDLHTSNLSQEVVNAYVTSGNLPGHIAHINKVYKEKRDAMLKKLESFPEGIKYTHPDGGLFHMGTASEGRGRNAHIQKGSRAKSCFRAGHSFLPGRQRQEHNAPQFLYGIP